MAKEIPVLLASFEAAGDLSSGQYRFVDLDANGRVTLCAAVDDKPIGVLQNSPDALGLEASVMIIGITKISSNAGLNEGDGIGTSTDAQALAHGSTNGTNIDAFTVGQVTVASANAGELASAAINCTSLQPRNA
jgi:hypothetical protein